MNRRPSSPNYDETDPLEEYPNESFPIPVSQSLTQGQESYWGHPPPYYPTVQTGEIYPITYPCQYPLGHQGYDGLCPPPGSFHAEWTKDYEEMQACKVELENAELFRQFNAHTTEMIITKAGRRMFPAVRIKISNLDPKAKYFVLMDVVPTDDYRYKYQNCRWITGGKADPDMPKRAYIHPDSPSTGAEWEDKTTSFHKMKLTNNLVDRNGYTVLSSMHRYQCRIHVVKANDAYQMSYCHRKTFVFGETQFIAVTAYQNERITNLKIQNNPFAKGFRENGAGHKRQASTRLAMRDGRAKVLRLAKESSDVPPAGSPQSEEAEEVKVTIKGSEKTKTSRKRKEGTKTSFVSNAISTFPHGNQIQQGLPLSPPEYVGWQMQFPNPSVGQQILYPRFLSHYPPSLEGLNFEDSYSGSYYTRDPSQRGYINYPSTGFSSSSTRRQHPPGQGPSSSSPYTDNK